MRPIQRLHRRFLVLGLALLTVSAAAGCMTVGRDFPTHSVDRIEIGTTTRDQIQEWFGEPFRTGIEDGRRTWTYGLYKYSAFGDPSTRDLVVRFDDRGVVTSFSFNTTEHGDLPARKR